MNTEHPNFLTCPGVPELGPPSSNTSRPPSKSVPQQPDRSKRRQAVRRMEPEQLVQSSRSPLSSAIPPVGTQPMANVSHGRRGIRVSSWILIACICVVCVLTGRTVFALARAGLSAQASQSAISRMVSALEDRKMERASSELDRAYDHMLDARNAMRGVGFWRSVPWIGVQLRAIEDATIAGTETLGGVKTVFVVATDLLAVAEDTNGITDRLDPGIDPGETYESISQEEKRAMLARLDRSLPDLRAAQAKIDLALSAWERIPQDRLIAPLRKAFQPITDGLPKLKRTIDEGLPLLELFIPLAGYPEEANYLIFLQNTDEIRGTGGFLGTIGRLDVQDGEIDEQTFKFVDIYAIDNPAMERGWSSVPPKPILDYMGVRQLFLRDVNWSPDFPTSASLMLDYYVREIELGTGKRPDPIDGIIAINPPLFEDLLRIVGPITIDGVTYEANTFFDVLEYEVEVAHLHKGIPKDERKAVVQKIGNELFARLRALPASEWSELLDVITKQLERKQIQIFATNPELQKRFDAFRWTGRIPSTEGDYIQVIDSNLAALKTDGVVDKSMTYSVDATDPLNIIATITLVYTNNAPGYADPNDPINFKYTRYRSYTRVYVPEGAELISSEGAMINDQRKSGGRVDVFKDLGKTVFGAFWSIEPKTSQTLRFTYKLPSSVAERLSHGEYLLDWQKQSGNDEASLTLDLKFGKTLKTADPSEDPMEWADAHYRVESNTLIDRRFRVAF